MRWRQARRSATSLTGSAPLSSAGRPGPRSESSLNPSGCNSDRLRQHQRVQPVGFGVLGLVAAKINGLFRSDQHHAGAQGPEGGGHDDPGVTSRFHHHGQLAVRAGRSSQSGPDRSGCYGTSGESRSPRRDPWPRWPRARRARPARYPMWSTGSPSRGRHRRWSHRADLAERHVPNIRSNRDPARSRSRIPNGAHAPYPDQAQPGLELSEFRSRPKTAPAHKT